jgi:hypothetical protein
MVGTSRGVHKLDLPARRQIPQHAEITAVRMTPKTERLVVLTTWTPADSVGVGQSEQPWHEFTFEDRSKRGRRKAEKYRAEVQERRRRRRRARYLRERAARLERAGLSPYAYDAYDADTSPPDPDNRICPRCGGVRFGRIARQESVCPGTCYSPWAKHQFH